jgi:iron transport multicopper oxidase
LIVTDPNAPYNGRYDEELVITLSDWYHDQMPGLIKQFLSVTNPTGAEPVPNSALMNDTQNLQIKVEPGKTYLIRFINMAAFAAQYVWIEDHQFRVVEVDGIWTEESEADLLYVSAAQRYSVLVTTKNDASRNFAINGAMDQDLFDKVPEALNPNVTSFLVYNSSAPMPSPTYLDEFDYFDDHTLVPYDRQPLLEDPDYSFKLDVKMDNLGDGVNYAFFNDITYMRQKVPSIYTALTTGSHASNPSVYGANTNTFVLEHNHVIEVVLNNHDPGKHPFHLHGHNFQAIVRGEENSNDYNSANATLPEVPMKRDTWVVNPNAHIVVRFRADNPGVWLFHCHIEWHVVSGLTATFVEVGNPDLPAS